VDKATLEPACRAFIERVGWKAKELFMTIRVAATGRTATPDYLKRWKCWQRAFSATIARRH